MDQEKAPKNLFTRAMKPTLIFQWITIAILLVLMLLGVIPSQWFIAGVIMTAVASGFVFAWFISWIPCPRCTKPARLKLSEGGYRCEFCQVIYTIIDKES